MSQTVVSISNSLIGEFDQTVSSFFSLRTQYCHCVVNMTCQLYHQTSYVRAFMNETKTVRSRIFLSRNNMYFYHVVKIRASYSCLGQQENSVSLSINVCSYDIGLKFVQVQCTCYCARLQQTTNRRTISYNQTTVFLSYAKGSEWNVKLVMRINFKSARQSGSASWSQAMVNISSL